jgi:predicted secreted protein
VSLSLENSTTKDTTGNWVAQEPVSLSYDITTSALVESGETITSSVDGQGLAELENIKEAGTPVKWQIANVSGANNRTKGSVIASGSAQLTQLEIQSQNRTAVQYNATLQGYGDYTVGA